MRTTLCGQIWDRLCRRMRATEERKQKGKQIEEEEGIAYRFLISLLFVFTGWLVLVPVSARAEQPFELHLLDVGQGQSVLIEADEQYMLIDGGGRKTSSFVVSYLKQQGIDHFDLIALSHYDEDHMSGEIGALSVFSVGTVLLPSYEGDPQRHSGSSGEDLVEYANILEGAEPHSLRGVEKASGTLSGRRSNHGFW